MVYFVVSQAQKTTFTPKTKFQVSEVQLMINLMVLDHYSWLRYLQIIDYIIDWNNRSRAKVVILSV